MLAPLTKAPQPKTASSAVPKGASEPPQRMPWRPGDRMAEQMLALQGPFGNQAVLRLRKAIANKQESLEVASVDDPLEREAERVAGQLMRIPAPSPPPRCACGGTPGPDGECAARKTRRLARLANTSAAPAMRSAPASVSAALSAPGRPLDVATRAFFEPRLHTDLSAVRIHDDATAAASADDVAAQAYTVGRDVVFGAGRHQPRSETGRALIAHELAHVVQQDSGRRAPGIQRKATTYTLILDHAPMSWYAVLVRMAMHTRKVNYARAVELVESGEYACGGHPACTKGIKDTSPIEFTIGHAEPGEKPSVPEKQAPKKAVAADPPIEAEDPEPVVALPAEIESALNNPYVRRFFAAGTQDNYLHLPAGQPNPDDYTSVNYVRDAVLRLNENELTCYRGFAAGRSLDTWTEIAKSLTQFGKVKAELCLAGDYPSPAPMERLRGADLYYEATMRTEALKAVFNKELADISGKHPATASVLPQTTDEPTNARVREMRRQVEASTMAEGQALNTAGFKTVAEFEQAANEFRLYFREYALKVAERMLFESGRVLHDAVTRYQLRGDKVPSDCQQLYDELYRSSGGRSLDQLKDAHPILRNPAVLHAVSPSKSVYEFSWRLTLFAHERLRDLGFVQNNLRREPDVVFRWDPVIKATFADLGLSENSAYAWIIREQLGKPGSSLGEKIIHYGLELLLFALSFVNLPVALTIAVAQATKDLAFGGIEYDEQMRASHEGFQEPPKLASVFIAPVMDLAPFALHGLFSWLKGLRGAGPVEKLAAGSAGTERKLEQSLAPPKEAPKPPLAPAVETPPGVTTEAPVARPAVDVEQPLAPAVETPPAVTPEPAVGAQPKTPPLIEPDARLVQAQERLATAQSKAEAARARLAAAGEKATAADEGAKAADAELVKARDEANAARSAQKRAEAAYEKVKSTKNAPRAGPRAEYNAAKDAAAKADKQLKNAAKRAEAAKAGQRDAAKAVPREQAVVGRAEQAVTAADEQRLIEVEADRVRNLPRNVEGLAPGWDYERFPNGPARAWRPGDAVNMPDAKGNYPVWDTVRRRIWINRATDELAERAAGRRVQAMIPPKTKGPLNPDAFEPVPKGGLEWLDPIREATDKELGSIASSGSMPARLGAEIEHARIPQRVEEMLEGIGVDANTARKVTKVGDPDNLMPTRKEVHAIVDEPARVINPNRNPTLEFSLDVRTTAPFREATDDEISAIVKAIEDRQINLGKSAGGRRLRAFLDAEKKLRPFSMWTVP